MAIFDANPLRMKHAVPPIEHTKCKPQHPSALTVRGVELYVDEKLFGRLLSIDEETGIFEAVRVSGNPLINGQKCGGIITTKANGPTPTIQ